METNKKRSVLSWLITILMLVPVSSFAAINDYFVETEWLAKHDKQVKVVDVRVAPLYLLGHIEGALHIDKSNFLFARDGVKSLVPTVADFEKLMNRFGISPEDTVVAYAEDHNPYSARFVWMLRYHGHEKSFVLNGGYEKWSNEGLDTAILPTKVVAMSGYKCKKSRLLRANGEDVLTRIGNPAVVVWDTRRLGEHLGDEVRADRGGHIPGSVHLDWVELQKEVESVTVLKSEEEIRSLLADKGITPDRHIIAHCQTGIRSSYATLVLLSLGYESAQNYDGSWIEWANNENYPVAKKELVAFRH